MTASAAARAISPSSLGAEVERISELLAAAHLIEGGR